MQLIVDYVSELCAAAGIDQCFEALERAVVRLGFDGIVYSSYLLRFKNEDSASPVLLRSEGFDAAFLKHYVETGFADRDFTIKRILRGDLNPIDWWQEDARGAVAREERAVIEVARHDKTRESRGACSAAGPSLPAGLRSNLNPLFATHVTAALSRFKTEP
ncbi:MAG: autoinducer binding domain-containing protein [Azonexus sp.]